MNQTRKKYFPKITKGAVVNYLWISLSFAKSTSEKSDRLGKECFSVTDFRLLCLTFLYQEVAAWRQLSTSSRLAGGHGHDHGHHGPAHGGEYRYEPIKCEIGKREVRN